MITNKIDSLEYLTFEKLSGIKHGFSTRYGGVSSGCYESLNLAFRDDKKENVIENYRIFCNALGVNYRDTVWTRQVHCDRVIVVDENDRGKGLFYPREEEGYDGIITNRKDVVLTGFSADCVLLYFYAPDKEVIAITHSGWRGTVKSIGEKTVEKMVKEFNIDRTKLIVGIAPAIGVCHFQVDVPVVSEFKKHLPFSDKYIKVDTENEGKYFLDLHAVNEEILINCGVKKENIENSKICTMCEPNRFFSHRIMGNQRGSLAGMISL